MNVFTLQWQDLQIHRQHLLPTRTIWVYDLEVSPTRWVHNLKSLHRWWPQYEHSCHNNSQCMFRCSSWREAFLGQDAPSCHWSAYLSSVRLTTVTRFWPDYAESDASVTVRLERRRMSRIFGEEMHHITPLLRELPWLKVPERILFWLGMLAYRCLHNTAQAYLAWSVMWTLEDIFVESFPDTWLICVQCPNNALDCNCVTIISSLVIIIIVFNILPSGFFY